MKSRKPAMAFPVRVPFVESLGIEMHGYGDGQADLRVDLTDAHLNTWEVAHGGVVMTMLDVAMAMAARSQHHGSGGVATVEMKTSFMRPAEGRLRALGRVLHKTSTLAFCEGSLYDDHEQLCAHATGTFKILRGLPTRAGITTPTATAAAPIDEPQAKP